MAFKHEVCKGRRDLCHSAIHLGTDWSSTARRFLTRPPLRLLCNRSPERASSPCEGLSILCTFL